MWNLKLWTVLGLQANSNINLAGKAKFWAGCLSAMPSLTYTSMDCTWKHLTVHFINRTDRLHTCLGRRWSNLSPFRSWNSLHLLNDRPRLTRVSTLLDNCALKLSSCCCFSCCLFIISFFFLSPDPATGSTQPHNVTYKDKSLTYIVYLIVWRVTWGRC